MKLPQPIPYQGSKRAIANHIISHFPEDVDVLLEPFAGSAAITIAAAALHKARRFYLNDLNAPLMSLWDMIINNPEDLSHKYENIWRNQSIESNDYYNKIRSDFNIDHNPAKFLYLLARCIKGSVRYNSIGEFNQAPDKRRLGKNPKIMQKEIVKISYMLKGKTKLASKNYLDIFNEADSATFLYLDPPYQGVCENRDTRYFNKVDYKEFVDSLVSLNERNIPFILSYDGRTGPKQYGKSLPASLGLRKLEINAGRSTQATLLGRSHITYEAVYLSPFLLNKINNKKSFLQLKPITSSYL
jgi:DNA adenine methylase